MIGNAYILARLYSEVSSLEFIGVRLPSTNPFFNVLDVKFLKSLSVSLEKRELCCSALISLVKDFVVIRQMFRQSRMKFGPFSLLV